MNPVEPLPYEGTRRLRFAENQPEYLPLSVAIDAKGMVITEWQPTEDELHRLLSGGRVRLCVHTFDPKLGEPGHFLQPVSLDVMEPVCPMEES